MKVIPFLLVLLILVGGVAEGFQTLNSNPADVAVVPDRATVTPRPRPTSPTLALATPTVIPTPLPEPTQAPAAQPPPEPTQTVAPPTLAPVAPGDGATLVVGNTEGLGVYLRRTPNLNDKIRPWVDGTPMAVVGPAVSAGGLTWQHVRAPDGADGYIPSMYLVGGGPTNRD